MSLSHGRKLRVVFDATPEQIERMKSNAANFGAALLNAISEASTHTGRIANFPIKTGTTVNPVNVQIEKLKPM